MSGLFCFLVEAGALKLSPEMAQLREFGGLAKESYPRSYPQTLAPGHWCRSAFLASKQSALAKQWAVAQAHRMKHLYLLFADLPYIDLRPRELSLGQSVQLARPDNAHVLLSSEDNQALAALVVPFEVARLGQVHVCLRTGYERAWQAKRAHRDIWTALLALRLATGIQFHATGTLVDDSGRLGPIGQVSAYSLRNPDAPAELTTRMVRRAARIHDRIAALDQPGLERARSALTYYHHSCMGFVESFQLSTVGLWGCIECIFPQPAGEGERSIDGEENGPRLARRISTYLGRDNLRPDFLTWLPRLYRNRNMLAHGFHPAPASRVHTPRNQRTLQELEKVARGCVLGMLGQTNDFLREYLPARTGRKRHQQKLDTVGAAPRSYLRGSP